MRIIFKNLKRFSIFLLILLFSSVIHFPAKADTQTNTNSPYNSVTNLYWTTDLGQTVEKFSQEIMFKKVDMDSAISSGWKNWFHTNLCWTKGNSLLNSTESCMWFGLGLSGKNGDRYSGTFDFTFIEGRDFNIGASDEGVKCRRDSTSSGQSSYTTCWLPVQIQLDHKYSFELTRNTQLGQNWWKARLIDLNVNESVSIGSIESNDVSSTTKLSSIYNHIGYGGKSVACYDIPAMDLLISQPSVGGKKSTFRNQQNGSCITTHLSESFAISSLNYYLMIGQPQPYARDQIFKISRVYFKDNNMIVEANLGNQISDQPDRVLLVAPKLGIETRNAQEGRINGNTASWTVPYSKSLAGSTIQVEITGARTGKQFTKFNSNVVLPGVSCPQITDVNPNGAQPKVLGFTFTGTNQKFVRVSPDLQVPVTLPANLIGCYIVPEMINLESPDWQIGSLNRDSNGFYFINAAGAIWRLKLIDNDTRLESEPNSPYYSTGRHFNLLLNSTSTSNTNTSNTNSGSSASNTVIPIKPEKPTFTGLNFVGNTLKVNVNIGTSGQSQPNKVYLIAPRIGIEVSNPLEGLIEGNKVSWSIPLDKSLEGVRVPIEVVSEKNGVKSDSSSSTFLIPKFQEITKPTSVPVTPKNLKIKILVDSALITVEKSAKDSALNTKGFLYSESLGIKQGKPIQGEILGNKLVLEIPLKAAMAGQKFPLTIYLSNEKGKSGSLKGVLSIPSSSSTIKIPSAPSNLNSSNTPSTMVICVRANQTRTFQGRNCPPGWDKR